jgi:hypothetical protein
MSSFKTEQGEVVGSGNRPWNPSEGVHMPCIYAKSVTVLYISCLYVPGRRYNSSGTCGLSDDWTTFLLGTTSL